jgi:hypothetical protein
MMLEQVIESARQAAYPAVTLTTFRDVPWNAPFYTRLGFSMLSELRLPAGLAAKGSWKRNTVCRRKRAAPCA